jgi:hypothetical protein
VRQGIRRVGSAGPASREEWWEVRRRESAPRSTRSRLEELLLIASMKVGTSPVPAKHFLDISSGFPVGNRYLSFPLPFSEDSFPGTAFDNAPHQQ